MSVLAEKIAEVVSSGGFRDDDGAWHAGLTVADAHRTERIIRVVREVLLSDETIEVGARQLYNNCRDLADPGPEWDALPMRDHPERGDFRENRSLYLADAEDILRAALDAVTTREEA